MDREYNLPVVLGKPKVAFRESLQERCKFDYLHKRQSGGAGQYGRVIGFMRVCTTWNFKISLHFLVLKN